MKQPKNLLLLALVAITLFGCIAMPCQTMPSEEANYHFTIKHSQSRSEAFNEVELALASAYNDLPRVLKLKQPDTGTFLLKPIVAYSNSPVRVQHAPYTLKIVVSEHSVRLDFELGLDEYGEWPPEKSMPEIRADFQSIAAQIARSVNGALE